jgi:hypothetical protein
VKLIWKKRILAAVATAMAFPTPILAAGAGGGGGIVNFSNMGTTAQALGSQGNIVGTVIMIASIVLGIAAVVAGRLNKSDLLSTAGAGVVGVTAVAAFITYGTGAVASALIGG